MSHRAGISSMLGRRSSLDVGTDRTFAGGGGGGGSVVIGATGTGASTATCVCGVAAF